MPSSVIRRFHYHPADCQLDVEFASGRRYSYRAVPADVFRAFKAASSKGEFFNAHIRDHFKFVRDPRDRENAPASESPLPMA